MLEMGNYVARGCEDYNETQAVTVYGIVPRPVLLRVGNEEASADVLDVERHKSPWDFFTVNVVAVVIAVAAWIERLAPEVHRFKAVVVDFTLAAAEIGGVEVGLAVDLGSREALIDGAIGRTLIG